MDRDGLIVEKAIDQLFKIADKRRDDLEQLKQAIKTNDSKKIKRYASRLCGINESY